MPFLFIKQSIIKLRRWLESLKKKIDRDAYCLPENSIWQSFEGAALRGLTAFIAGRLCQNASQKRPFKGYANSYRGLGGRPGLSLEFDAAAFDIWTWAKWAQCRKRPQRQPPSRGSHLQTWIASL